jgi:hypothetical protein
MTHLEIESSTRNDLGAMKKNQNTMPGPTPRNRYPKKASAAMAAAEYGYVLVFGGPTLYPVKH